MRVIQVVPAVSIEASGPSHSVPRLCESLIRSGMDVQLAALDWSPLPVIFPYLKLFSLWRSPRRLCVSPSMRRWLEAEADSGKVDFIHTHGLWTMPNVYSGWACKTNRSQLVVSPRGTLSEWALARNPRQKRIFWWLWQAPVLRAASLFHATAEHEFEDIRRSGFRQPVCILPNGIDVPPLEETPKGTRRQLLFLGRIHPVKGIDVLLRAWQVVGRRFPDWDLCLVGPDSDGYLAEMKTLATRLRLERVVFRGPLFGEEKLRAYRAASLFVLPTHSENFGMTVAEALAAGTPAIVTKGAPWSGLDAKAAGWWIDIGVDPLVACLEKALATPPATLAEMGRAGRDWMLQDYSWEQIGTKLATTYRWVLEGGEAPSWVRLS